MIDARLSIDIEVGAKARPRFKTDKVVADGGYVVRNRVWRYPLFDFEFDICPALIDDEGDPIDPDPTEIAKLEEFYRLFMVVGGAGIAFPFRHWRDYRGTHEFLGTGDGTTTQFQLFRNYSLGASTRRRKILLPVLGTVTGFVNGASVPISSVNRGTGIVEFTAAPGAASSVAASFEFDVPVCFADDTIEMVSLTDVLDQPATITLEEVRAV